MKFATYNPHGKALDSLPTIFGFNNGGPPEFLSALLVAEDGTFLGGHCCSHECFMPGDLGVLEGCRPDRHETFKKHYPDGYRMEFVGFDAVKSHPKLWPILEAANKAEKEPSKKGDYPSISVELAR